MAENNRNQRGNSYRTSNQDWNENRGRGSRNWEDDRSYSSSENRGYGNTGSRDYDDTGSAGWQSRYQREEYNRGGGYQSGRYGRHMENDFNSGNYNDRDYGYSSNYGGTSGSAGGYGGSRGMYDRDTEMGRRGSYDSGMRMGGSNYGGGYSERDRGYDYEGRNRDWNELRNRDYNEGRGTGYTGYSGNTGGYGYGSGSPGSGSGYGGYRYGAGGASWVQRDRDRDDRGFWDRASDEVASWFGDDDAERRRDRDRQMRNSNRGKGPRNYSRSDERIKEDINDRLSDDPFVDASEIDVTVSSGEVTLTGTVDDRSNKRRAEDIAEDVSGVKNVENRIRVNQSSALGTGTTGTRTTGSLQSRESQTSEYRNPEREATKGTGTNSKKDYVTG